MAPREISLITGNANKLADVKEILEPRGFLIMNQSLDIPELQGTIEEISIAKCRRAAELVRDQSVGRVFVTLLTLHDWM